MDPMQYAFAVIGLWAAGIVGALFAWRALYRIYSRWRNAQDAAAARARMEEQTRRLNEKMKYKD